MELCRSKQTPYPKDEQVNISPVLFRIVDFANTSANLHLHENHNLKKRWRGMRLHFPDINGTKKIKQFTELICVFDCGAIYSEDMCVFTK